MAPVCAVVVAGGSGQRFGNPGGKQLVNVAGRPLMSWSIRAFDRSNKVGHIVVVCPAERRAEMRRLAISPYSYSTPISFADAGETRQDSTRAGVHAVPAGFEYVAIHDGARPLITTEAIDHAIDVLVSDRALDGVVCGQPAIDTLKIVDGDNIVETPPRELYWAAQTPQIFIVDEYGSLQELMDDISEDPERLGDFGVNNPAILADSLYRMKGTKQGNA